MNNTRIFGVGGGVLLALGVVGCVTVPPTPVAEGGPRPLGISPQMSGKMRVLCTEPGKPISPRIYGIAFADSPKELGATQHRWGGNPTSRYNFELGNAWNTGSDWFFQNVKSTPEMVGAWVKRLREADQKAGKRRVVQWILDNEPALWHSTHRDVHPLPTTYDELLEKTLQYAKVVREADPEGELAGPSAWGWPE